MKIFIAEQYCFSVLNLNSIEDECSTIHVELSRINAILKKNKNANDKELTRINDKKIKVKYRVDKLQRELEEERIKWKDELGKHSKSLINLDYQKYEILDVLEHNIQQADQEFLQLQHESRNTGIRLETESKRLKEKMLAMNMMIHNQDAIPTSNGKVIVKQVSKDSSMASFYSRMRKIVNGDAK